jgi:hypothetical protein
MVKLPLPYNLSWAHYIKLAILESFSIGNMMLISRQVINKFEKWGKNRSAFCQIQIYIYIRVQGGCAAARASCGLNSIRWVSKITCELNRISAHFPSQERGN